MTYKRIAAEVSATHGRAVKTCWIAHVKESNGLPVRKAPDRKLGQNRENPCPDAMRALIEDAMRQLKLLP